MAYLWLQFGISVYRHHGVVKSDAVTFGKPFPSSEEDLLWDDLQHSILGAVHNLETPLRYIAS